MRAQDIDERRTDDPLWAGRAVPPWGRGGVGVGAMSLDREPVLKIEIFGK